MKQKEGSMRRYVKYSLLLLVSAACSNNALPTNSVIGPSPLGTQAASAPLNFRTHLSFEEVVPALPVPSGAQGQAIFQLDPGGTELLYRVNVANIENVVGAHIHLAAAGSRGPLVALLLTPVPPPAGGRTDGVLAKGALTAEGLFGPLAGQSLAALVDAITAGNAYVDIPTNDGGAPANTGPGDYPGGELRGQIR
jgi:hypothetical protein